MRAIDITGKQFGRLTALALSSKCVRRKDGSWMQRRWLCRCECGKNVILPVGALNNGHTQSCGCLKVDTNIKRLTTHGLAGEARISEYGIWSGMRRRCQDPSNPEWRNYGGRGIQVCHRWETFEWFLIDVGPRPSKNYSLDRYPDNDGNYEPGNCRWATRTQQRANQRFPTIKQIIEANVKKHGIEKTLEETMAAVMELLDAHAFTTSYLSKSERFEK